MGSTVFDHFTKLSSKQDNERVDGGIGLIRHMSRSEEQDENKEWKYALTRLVRGLGSSKVFSRKGYYTTLTVFLMMHPEISVNEILSLVEAELCPASSNPKSENADIYMGRVLTYGALIRSKVLLNSPADIQQRVIEDLINCGKRRSYLSFVSISFFIEFLDQLDIESFNTNIWPLAEKEFCKEWSGQNLDTFYVLLIMTDKFPSLFNRKFLKKHFGVKNIISKESVENIVKILTDVPRIISHHHPVFQLFCEKLVSTELIIEFWTKIEERFTKPSKSDERLAVEIFKFLLPNIKDKSIIPSLLSTNFTKHMLRKFSNCKRKDDDEVCVAFKKSLTLLVTAMSKDVQPETQIDTLKKLILDPGDLMIEKKTGTKVIQMLIANLKSDSVKKLSELYKDIIENKICKEKENSKAEPWTNAERTYTSQLLTRLMGHSAMSDDHEWRLVQLKFLFTYGLCDIANVGMELHPQFKESFYRALDHKLPKVTDLRNEITVLSTLVRYIDKGLTSKEIKLKNPLSNEALQAGRKAIELIDKLEKNSKLSDAVLIFHTMILHMGLQLFSDQEMAIMSIDELQNCYERLAKKSKKNKKSEAVEEEPEWVEVVVDLLLSLLSRNSHLLRSLVGCVFPHICPHLTPNAISQILAVLDVNDQDNPLTTEDEIDSESDNDDSSAESNASDTSEDTENEEDESSEINDSDLEEESLDEEETVNDKLRLAVRQALGDASVQTDDEDMDIDEIDEEEGKRLDESLAAAFKMLRANRQNKSRKQEKSAQALTHFRVRVMDLLDDYLESEPPMALVINMLVPLFTLLEFCIKDPHQKPLENRVRSCLKRLSNVRKFQNSDGVNDELLMTVLKALVEKGERSASVCQEMSHKLAECCTFLIKCTQQINLSSKILIDIYAENLKAFFKTRDCILPATLFKGVLQLNWDGNWQLAPMLVDFAFDNTMRSFRRSQALEFLTIFYKNNRSLRTDTEHTDIRIDIEEKLCKNSVQVLEDLCSTRVHENGQTTGSNDNIAAKEIRQKFVCLLLTLLHSIYPQHLPKAWDWESIGKVLTTCRTHTLLNKDAKKACNKLAIQLGMSSNISSKKNEVETPQINDRVSQETNKSLMQNGDVDDEEKLENSKKDRKRKKKAKQSKNLKLKKEAKELRLKTMSEGLESLSFSSMLLNGVEEKSPEEDDSHSSQKRVLADTADTAIKSKRKKSKESA